MSEQAPAPGDLLISRRAADGHFEISIVPGRPQISVAQQHEAVKRAYAYAEKNGSSVWMVDAKGYVRLNPPKRRDS